jgi:hypothetical protein
LKLISQKESLSKNIVCGDIETYPEINTSGNINRTSRIGFFYDPFFKLLFDLFNESVASFFSSFATGK